MLSYMIPSGSRSSLIECLQDGLKIIRRWLTRFVLFLKRLLAVRLWKKHKCSYWAVPVVQKARLSLVIESYVRLDSNGAKARLTQLNVGYERACYEAIREFCLIHVLLLVALVRRKMYGIVVAMLLGSRYKFKKPPSIFRGKPKERLCFVQIVGFFCTQSKMPLAFGKQARWAVKKLPHGGF